MNLVGMSDQSVTDSLERPRDGAHPVASDKLEAMPGHAVEPAARKPRAKRPRPTFDDGSLTRAFKFPSKTYPRSTYYVTGTEIIIRIKKARKKWKLVIPKKRVRAYRTNRWFAKPRWVELELTYTQAVRLGLVEPRAPQSAAVETPAAIPIVAEPVEASSALGERLAAEETALTASAEPEIDWSTDPSTDEADDEYAEDAEGMEAAEDSEQDAGDVEVDAEEQAEDVQEAIGEEAWREQFASDPAPAPPAQVAHIESEPAFVAPLEAIAQPEGDPTAQPLAEACPAVVSSAVVLPAAPLALPFSDVHVVVLSAPPAPPTPIALDSSPTADAPRDATRASVGAASTRYRNGKSQSRVGASVLMSLAVALTGASAAWLTLRDHEPAQIAQVDPCSVPLAADCSRGIVTGSVAPIEVPPEPALQVEASPAAHTHAAPVEPKIEHAIVVQRVEQPSPAEPATPDATAIATANAAPLSTPEPASGEVPAFEPLPASPPPHPIAIDAAAVPPPAPAAPDTAQRTTRQSTTHDAMALNPIALEACRDLTAAASTLDIRYAYASASLDPSILPALEALAGRVAGCAAATPVSVIVEGHTDAEGDTDRNQALSVRRAQAVWEHLVKSGVRPGQLSVVGFGHARPLAPNDTPENRRLNRRATVVVELPSISHPPQ